jgi:hypothetical protein
MILTLSEQKGCVLILPILTLCCPATAFYRLPYPTAFAYTTRIVFYGILSSKNKNQFLRMRERSAPLRELSERMNEYDFYFEFGQKNFEK